jgi:glycerol uptake facilitator-like aquaporin
VPLSVALYIGAAIWFRASTRFANPAIIVSRAFTDSFCGTGPEDVPGLIAAQPAGALLGTGFGGWRFRDG